MSTTAIELALFPLNVVLFPGTVLPLHIFEARYRQMIMDCQQEMKPFGVVLIRPESEQPDEIPYSVGTVAEIRNLDKLDDGGYNLIAVGTRRFQIVEQYHDKPYLSGLVEPYEDVSEPIYELEVLNEQARDLFGRYLGMLLEAMNEDDVQTNLPATAESLSHFIAYFLEIQDERKQHFLELTSTRQRLREEIGILRREVPFLRQIITRQISDEQTRLN
ncbi:LON peptidase substrate-binding domain-containing protein [Ktedonosporobacter rubrisoli]|nr:LON peptidase substrate-binding domain-containing protein [Ktedonosporobacter rubrisoli]